MNLVVATVAEDREPFRTEALYLFRSLRRLGGTLATAMARAYFVDSIDEAVEAELASMGVQITLVSAIDRRCPHANKLHALDETQDFDYLVALDNDTVIVRDFSDFVTGNSIRARPAGRDPMTIAQWQALFAHFGLELPLARWLTSYDLAETIPYFNSAVLVIPQAYVVILRKAWKSAVLALLDAYASFPELERYRYFTDQIAFPLALTAAQLPYCALPLEMYFLAHTTVHPAFSPERITPYILHHHHGVAADGRLRPSNYQSINAAIDAINAVVP